MLPKLALVLGGANCGKSSFAESLVLEHAESAFYIATAQAWDDEMKAKIARHKTRRGGEWTTIEEPLDIGRALRKASGAKAILIDCATLWLSNHLLADHDLTAQETKLVDALDDIAAPVLIVSNEVGQCVVPDNALARRFQSAQGRLNQRLAARADLVVAVMAGLPLVLKGRLPGD